MQKQFLFILFVFVGHISFAQEEIIFLYNGNPPGSENWDWSEKEIDISGIGDKMVYNVSRPTLTVFRPEHATGSAIIICPGGGFHFLSIDNEGFEVAKWLNAKGITAFVLKYRLVHCLTDNPMQEFIAKQPNTEKFNKDVEPVVAMAINDGKEAISYVRSHSTEFGIAEDKIGIIGFSAGGTVTTGVSYTYDLTNRPDFVAPIYPFVGSFDKPAVPQDAPPMFILAASDDFFGFQNHCIKLYSEWNAAGKQVEMHLYAKGDHGFGMRKKNLPVDTWINLFYEWMTMNGFE